MSVATLHPRRLALYIVLSAVDLLLTYQLIKLGGGYIYESNPLADAWLRSYGWPGVAFFKLMSIFVVGGVAVYVSIYRPATGSRLMTFACVAVACVVIYSASLVHYFGKHLPTDSRRFVLDSRSQSLVERDRERPRRSGQRPVFGVDGQPIVQGNLAPLFHRSSIKRDGGIGTNSRQSAPNTQDQHSLHDPGTSSPGAADEDSDGR